MINIGGKTSQRNQYPLNSGLNEGKFSAGSHPQQKRRGTYNNSHRKGQIMLSGEKCMPKRFPTSSESNLASAFQQAQFRALSPKQIDQQRGINGLTSVNSQVFFMKNTRQSIDQPSIASGMPSELGSFSQVQDISTIKKQSKKRRLQSASFKVLDSHNTRNKIQRDQNNFDHMLNGLYQKSSTVHNKLVQQEVVGQKLSPKQNPMHSFKSTSKAGPKSAISQLTTTAQSQFIAKSHNNNQAFTQATSPVRFLNDQLQPVQQVKGDHEHIEVMVTSPKKPFAFSGRDANNRNQDLKRVIEGNNSFLNVQASSVSKKALTRSGIIETSTQDETYYARVDSGYSQWPTSQTSYPKPTNQIQHSSPVRQERKKKSTPIGSTQGAYNDRHYTVLNCNETDKPIATFGEAVQNFKPQISTGRHESTITGGGSIDMDFGMFKSQPSHAPLKHVMSAGQFNIAKNIDYVGVKVTEVNAAATSAVYGDDIRESFQQISRSRSRTKQRKHSASRPKSSKPHESESPQKYRKLVKCVAQGNGPVFEKRSITDKQFTANSSSKSRSFLSPGRQNNVQSNFSTTGFAFPITSNNLQPNTKCNFTIKPNGNLADYGLVDPEQEQVMKRDLNEVVDTQLNKEDKQYVKQKRAKKILETQINKEKRIVARKYQSQTTVQQQKNVSNQRRVFDARFKQASFPSNFWFGKHVQKDSFKQTSKKIANQLKNCLSEEKQKRVPNYFRPEMIAKGSGISQTDAEVALQYYQQIKEALPPRRIAHRNTHDIQMPLAFSHMADESRVMELDDVIDSEINKLRISSNHKRASAKRSAIQSVKEGNGTPNMQGYFNYKDGSFALDKYDSEVQRRASVSKEATPRDHVDKDLNVPREKRIIKVDTRVNSKKQTLEDEHVRYIAPQSGSDEDSVVDLRSNYADQIAEVEFQDSSVLETRFTELHTPVRAGAMNRNNFQVNSMTNLPTTHGTTGEQYAIQNSIMRQYGRDLQDICAVSLQKQETEVQKRASQVGFAGSVSFMDQMSEKQLFTMRQTSMKSLQPQSCDNVIQQQVKVTVSPNKGTISSTPMKSTATNKTSHTRCKTAKYRLAKKKLIINSKNLYAKATIDLKPDNFLSRKVLIEAQSSSQAPTSLQHRVISKTKSMPLLDILSQANNTQSKQSPHYDIGNLLLESDIKKTVQFQASTLFKERLTSENVLPKANIKYITSPLKMLVMK